MLDSFFSEAAAARLRATPLGPWLGSFLDRLSGQGYTPWSCRAYVVLAADLGRWMADHGVLAEELDEPVIDAHVEHRKTQHDRRRAASVHLLAHLRSEGVARPRRSPPDLSPVSRHCFRFGEYLRKQRGAAKGTVDGYVAVIRAFLDQRFESSTVDIASLTAKDIGDYLVGRSAKLSPKRVAYLATALRSFFRFLFVGEETATDLSSAALSSMTRHLASVPRYLTPAEIERLIDTCDSEIPAGRRNRAILLLLARLGLRAGEVAALELDDVRWKSGEIVVRGKGDAIDRLPLPPDVGKALALYLVKDRAKTLSRRIFLRLCAPVRELGGRSAISSVVRSAIEKAGLQPQARGAHLLRHSLGTRMIRAGASLAEIGEVLRHRSPGSAEIYAKVDFEALRALALPWPGSGGAR